MLLCFSLQVNLLLIKVLNEASKHLKQSTDVLDSKECADIEVSIRLSAEVYSNPS